VKFANQFSVPVVHFGMQDDRNIPHQARRRDRDNHKDAFYALRPVAFAPAVVSCEQSCPARLSLICAREAQQTASQKPGVARVNYSARDIN